MYFQGVLQPVIMNRRRNIHDFYESWRALARMWIILIWHAYWIFMYSCTFLCLMEMRNSYADKTQHILFDFRVNEAITSEQFFHRVIAINIKITSFSPSQVAVENKTEPKDYFGRISVNKPYLHMWHHWRTTKKIDVTVFSIIRVVSSVGYLLWRLMASTLKRLSHSSIRWGGGQVQFEFIHCYSILMGFNENKTSLWVQLCYRTANI